MKSLIMISLAFCFNQIIWSQSNKLPAEKEFVFHSESGVKKYQINVKDNDELKLGLKGQINSGLLGVKLFDPNGKKHNGFSLNTGVMQETTSISNSKNNSNSNSNSYENSNQSSRTIVNTKVRDHRAKGVLEEQIEYPENGIWILEITTENVSGSLEVKYQLKR